MVTLYREEGDAFIVGEEAIIVSIEAIEHGRIKLCFNGKEPLMIKNSEIIPHIRRQRSALIEDEENIGNVMNKK